MGRRLTEEDDKIIVDLYINQKKSSVEIGEILQTSHRTVLNHLDKMGIERRCLSESQFVKNNKDIPREFYDYNKMYDLYVTQHYTKEQLGIVFDCAPHVINRILKNLGIHIRDASEAKIGVQSGSSHHNWKGGISTLEARCRQFYQDNISPKIRERDNYECQLCGCKSNLHTHHKIPFSTIVQDICCEHKELDPIDNVNELYNIIINDKRFLDEDNLITYCKNCHLFTIHGYNKTIRSEASYSEERSTTTANAGTSQAIGDGNGESP